MSLITLDFETYYASDYSLSKMSTEAYIRDPRFQVIGCAFKIDNDRTRWIEGPRVAEHIAAIDWGRHFVLAHNAMFDGAILSWHFGAKPRFWLDTLSMARPLHGLSVGCSLAKLVSHYGLGEKGTEVVKALGKRWEDFGDYELAEYGRYCINDVELTHKLFGVLKKGFPKGELQVIDLMLRMFTEPILDLNQKVLHEHLAAVQEKRWNLLQKVNGQSDIINSNPKFAALLRRLGVEPPTKESPRTGEKTYAFAKTDVDFKALLEHPDARVQIVVGVRLGTKTSIEETRTKAFLEIAERGSLPVPLGYYNAHTGRAGGMDGINLQNLPRGGALRRSIVAPPGNLLVACDSSQIEARVNAWLSEQDDLVQAFAEKRDVYSECATDIYGRPVNRKLIEVDADGKEFYPFETEGFVGKTCILSMQYGVGSTKFQSSLATARKPVVIDDAEAKRIVNAYRRRYGKIKGMWDTAQSMLSTLLSGGEATFGRGNLLVVNQGCIWLPNGMALRYPDLQFDGKEYTYQSRKFRTKLYGGKMTENFVSALSRIIVFDQMIQIATRYKVVLTVHDEVVVCVPEGEAEDAKKFMVGTMSAAPEWAPGLPVACEANVGRSYADAK